MYGPHFDVSGGNKEHDEVGRDITELREHERRTRLSRFKARRTNRQKLRSVQNDPTKEGESTDDEGVTLTESDYTTREAS